MPNERQIGARLVLNGEQKYNAALRDVNANLKLLRSEMKESSSLYAKSQNSLEALSKKHEILTKTLEEQKNKVRIYNEELRKQQEIHTASSRFIDEYTPKLSEEKTKLQELIETKGRDAEETKKQAEVVSKLQKELNLNRQNYEKSGDAIKNFSAQGNNAQAEVHKLSNELKTTGKHMEEAKNSADGCAKSINALGKESGETSPKINSTGEAVDALAQAMAASGIVSAAKEITGGLIECAEAADKYQTSVAKVQSIAQVSQEDLKKMSGEMQDIAVKYGVSANEIAEATYQAISASVRTTEATDFVEKAVKLARGGFTEVATAVDIMTTATNAYGKQADTTVHIMDALVQTQNKGKTTVAELAQNMGMAIPTAAAYGVNLDNLSAGYIQLTKNGINTANATTMLNGMLTELADQGSGVAKILKEKTGKSFGQLMKDGMSLGEVIQILGDYVDGDSEAFANLWGNVRASRGAVTIFNNGARAFNESLDSVINSAGAADAAFEVMADTSEMTGARLDAAMENAKVTIGEALQPAIDSLKEKGIEMLEPFTEFVRENPRLVTAMAGTVVAVTGVSVAVGICAAAVALLKASFGDLTGVAAVLGTAAVVGGVIGFSDAMTKSADSAKAMAKAAREAHEEVEKTMTSNEEEAERIKTLSARMEELQKQESLSTEEKMEMRNAVNALNEVFPDLCLVLDDSTGKLVGYNDELKQSLDLQVQQYEIGKKQEEINALVAEQAELKERLAAADEAVAEAQARFDEDGKAGYRGMVVGKQLEEEIAARDELSRMMDENRVKYEELSGEVQSGTEALQAHSQAVEDDGAAVSEVSEEIQKAYKAAHESAVSSLGGQTDKFVELAEQAPLTSQQVVDSLNSIGGTLEKQREGLQKYSDLLTEAYDFMTENDWSQGYLSTIIAQGPEASTQLEALMSAANGSSDSIQYLKDVCETFDETSKMIDDIASVQAGLETGYVEAADAAVEAIESNMPRTTEALSDEYALQLEDIEKHKEDMTDQTAETMENVAGAVTDNTQLVTDAATAMLDKTKQTVYTSLQIGENGGRSMLYYNLGKDSICKSIADGIDAGTSQIERAVKSMCNKIVSSVDVSGLVGRINRQLGESYGN